MNDEILNICIEALERGEPLEEVLSWYPAEAEELRPVLEVVGALAEVAASHEPNVDTEMRARLSFLEQADSLRRAASTVSVANQTEMPGARAEQLRRLQRTDQQRALPIGRWMLYTGAVAAVLVMVFGFVLVAGSANALPGDTLYGAKRTVEGVRLMLSGSTDSLNRELNAKRIEEIRNLISEGRSATNLTFEGSIDLVGSGDIVVEGIIVHIDEASIIQGEPAIGRYAHVEGLVANGRFLATRVVIEAGPDEAPQEDIIETPDTPAPVETNTLEVEPDPEPEEEEAPEQLIQPEVVVTATPEPVLPENTNENSNENTAPDDGGGSSNENTGHDDDESSDSSNGNSGDDDEDSSNSGSGSGDDDEDNSESGSSGDDDDSENSGSGSSGSGGGESDD